MPGQTADRRRGYGAVSLKRVLPAVARVVRYQQSSLRRRPRDPGRCLQDFPQTLLTLRETMRIEILPNSGSTACRDAVPQIHGGTLRLATGATQLISRRDVWTEMRTRIPLTLELTLLATTSASIIAIPIGVISAIKRTRSSTTSSDCFNRLDQQPRLSGWPRCS